MTENPILREVKDNVDIVPYTTKDRVLQWSIFILVCLNLLAVIVGFIWGI